MKGILDNITSGNCYGQNTQSLGVCFEGNCDKDREMTQAQLTRSTALWQVLISVEK